MIICQLLGFKSHTDNRTGVETHTTFFELAEEADLLRTLRELIVSLCAERTTSLRLLGNRTNEGTLAVVKTNDEIVSRAIKRTTSEGVVKSVVLLADTKLVQLVESNTEDASSTSTTIDVLTNAIRKICVGSTTCLLYTSPSPRDVEESRMPSSA